MLVLRWGLRLIRVWLCRLVLLVRLLLRVLMVRVSVQWSMLSLVLSL